MNTSGIIIATAKINNLHSSPYYIEDMDKFFYDILLYKCSNINFPSYLTKIYVGNGDDMSAAENRANTIKKNIAAAGISERDTVIVLLNKADHGRPVAIGAIGKDSWIDIKDKWSLKTFEELAITITLS